MLCLQSDTTLLLLLLYVLLLIKQGKGYQVLPTPLSRYSSNAGKTNNVAKSSLGRTNDDPDDFPEYTGENVDATIAAPTIDRDNYTPESEIARQANDLLLRSGTQTIELQRELSNSFLQYALSIIMGRAIPDARDGLKPVHRRILFAMHELQLNSSGSYRKCARVVGDVLGKLHPHGDTAVYDALVRLAQDFSTNHPLVDGHGNFGSIDADPAAAMRYTECRLTPLSQSTLLTDLGENTVDMIPNFDGTSSEPVVLPAKVPVLLINGSSGIAVGMATNIPPHNLREILSACQAIAKERITGKPLSTDQLLKIVPGPDFPTGAFMMGTEGAKKMYTTGNGGVVLRAVTKIEQVKTGKTSRTAIIVTELPYQVNKAALLERIAALVNDKKLDGIADLRDESSGREGIRMVIDLKRDAVPAVVLANLYQKTPLQTSFAGNLLALMVPNRETTSLVPQRFTLRQSLDCFMDFRFQTIRRKASFQLFKVENRAHIVEGLLLALEKMDAVIEAVRSATNTQDAKRILQEELLKTTEDQTDAILRMQLGQLTRLNKGKLESERDELLERKQELTRLIEVDPAVYDEMIDEFNQFSRQFGVPRRTMICADEEGEQNQLDLVPNSRSVIVVTQGGYIKRMPLKTFTSQKRGTRGKRATVADPDNEVAYTFSCNDHDTLLMVSDSGIAFGLHAYQVPGSSATARGNPIPSVLPQLKPSEVITTVLPVSEFSNEDEFLLLATENGWLKKTPLAAFGSLTNRGLVAAKLDAGDRLLWCQRCHDGDDVLVGSKNGMACRFPVETVRPTARSSRGLRIMNLREGDKIADVNMLDAADKGHTLVVSACGFGKRVLTSLFTSRRRGLIGVVALNFKKDYEGKDSMICLRSVKEDDEVLLTTANGIMVRQKVADISAQGRASTGVLVQKLDNGDLITSVSVISKHEGDDDDEEEESD